MVEGESVAEESISLLLSTVEKSAIFSVVRSKLISEAEDYQIRQLAQTPVQEKNAHEGGEKRKKKTSMKKPKRKTAQEKKIIHEKCPGKIVQASCSWALQTHVRKC